METATGAKKKWRTFRVFAVLSLLAATAVTIILLSFWLWIKILGPPPLSIPQSTLYYASDGSIIGESNSGEKRYWISLDEVPSHVSDAVIAIEDRTFYSHHGFDLKRIAGAIAANVKAMGKVQGASTITQQYARNLFLTLDKTWSRKLLEAFYTIRLEVNYDKDEILEGYINTISFGHGAYGIEAASQFYYGKSAKELTIAEASILAGIPKGPGIYSPIISEEKAKSRQALVLGAMVKTGAISPEEAKAASQEKLFFIGKHPHHQAEKAPYFYDTVKKELKEKAGLDDRSIALGGLKVYTALDVKQQDIAEKVISETISETSDIQAGFAAMDPETGHVTALVGGRNYKDSSFNRATQAVRQPGSTIKPLLYYAALEHGFTPSTVLRSEPTTFRFSNGQSDYTPHNFNNQYANGEITMAQALALSDNVYAVKTHLFLGQDALVNTIRRLGISTKMKNVPSLALGTSGVKPIELLNAYSIIANGGKKVEPVFIVRVEDFRGKVIYEEPKIKEQVLEPEFAFVLSHMMTGMFDKKLNGYATVTGESVMNQMSREYAGKSGSTNSDSWMAGFTPKLASVVWTGYDKGKEITLTEDKLYAKNIWIRFMERSLEGQDEKEHAFLPPAKVTAVPVDPVNGKKATNSCPVFRLTYFVKGTEPTEFCTDHLHELNKERVPHKKEKKKHWWQRIF
ncbi:PBP1A family penicillin-binding protein [Siminovitchia fortis]|uniref:PBP1A family penicillin-binding protein n=1 Tax=Siminovitchia fortis TaxID=254758 RepID=A0A443IWQ5_9BACI|nr:PBP1A family penicillin-binding protein [Siminovitchia fortis]RWR12489.1 PBP1A family penicillin-binding protein [Siminovitchia fortis]WHY81672.1 PBP1A family penicillin-binding protein [Siminovitchia fortis]